MNISLTRVTEFWQIVLLRSVYVCVTGCCNLCICSLGVRSQNKRIIFAVLRTFQFKIWFIFPFQSHWSFSICIFPVFADIDMMEKNEEFHLMKTSQPSIYSNSNDRQKSVSVDCWRQNIGNVYISFDVSLRFIHVLNISTNISFGFVGLFWDCLQHRNKTLNIRNSQRF